MAIDDLRRRGRFVELAAALAADEQARPAIDGPFRDRGGDPVELAARLHERGHVDWLLARFDAAGRNLARALELREELLGPADPRTVDTRARIAALYHYLLDDRAEALFRDVLAQREAAHGDESAEAAIARRNLGALLRDTGQHHDARALLDRAVKELARRRGKDDPDYAAALKARAYLLQQQDESNAAMEGAAEDALVAAVRAHDVDHPFAAAARLLLARANARSLRYSAAAKEIAATLSGLRAGYGDDHPLIGIALTEEGRIRFQQGDVEAGLDRMRRGDEIHRKWYPRGAAAGVRAYDIAGAAAMLGDVDEARVWVGHAADAVADDLDGQQTLVPMMLLVARRAASAGDLECAAVLLERAEELDRELSRWNDLIARTAAHLASCRR